MHGVICYGTLSIILQLQNHIFTNFIFAVKEC